MKRLNRRVVKKSLGTMMRVVLVLLFVGGTAFGSFPFPTPPDNTPDTQQGDGSGNSNNPGNEGGGLSLFPDNPADGQWGDNSEEGEDDWWDDGGEWDDMETGCISVTGIPESEIDFVVVPSKVPGPGEKDYSEDEFMDSMLGFGFSAEKGKPSILPFWGTDADISGGLKVYKETISESGDEKEAGFTYTLIEGTTAQSNDCADMEEPLTDEICVTVTGVTGEDVEFVMVPADLPGPGEEGFDINVLYEKMLGSGDIYRGELFAEYFGTEAALTEPGVKIYKYEYDKSLMDDEGEMEEWLKTVKLTLIPGTTVVKSDCPELPPVPEEVCVSVTGVTGENQEFAIVPADIPGPGEEGFSVTGFLDEMVGGGELYDGKIYTDFYGDKAVLDSPGVKVYKLEYEEDENQKPVPFETFVKSTKITLIPDAGVEKTDCPDPLPEPEEICIQVDGLTAGDMEFVIVPDGTPEPGDSAKEAFFEAVVGSGGVFQGKVFSFYYGSEEQLKTPGVKVYGYTYDEETVSETMDIETLFKNVKLTLIPGATVKKADCPEPTPEDDFEGDSEDDSEYDSEDDWGNDEESDSSDDSESDSGDDSEGDWENDSEGDWENDWEDGLGGEFGGFY